MYCLGRTVAVRRAPLKRTEHNLHHKLAIKHCSTTLLSLFHVVHLLLEILALMNLRLIRSNLYKEFCLFLKVDNKYATDYE